MFYHNTLPGKSMALFKNHIFRFSFLSSSLTGQNKCSDFSIGRSHKFQKNTSKTTIPIWRHYFRKNWNSGATYFQKIYIKSTLRKAYKKWNSILGFIFFNRTLTQIFKKTIFRTIFIWRHCKSPRKIFIICFMVDKTL